MHIQVINHGTVVQFVPRDREAKRFLRKVGAEDWQYLGHSLVMDWRVARCFIESTANIIQYEQSHEN